MELTEKIEIQRRKIKAGNPAINLIDSCQIDNGIVQLSSKEMQNAANDFDSKKKNLDLCFFVPASGSGSRMFKAFYDFLATPEKDRVGPHQNLGYEMICKLQELGIANLLTSDLANLLAQDDEKYADLIIKAFIDEHQLNISSWPKGLIPFHIYEDKILNPFQEHLIHSKDIGNPRSKVHFTINRAFEKQISETVDEISCDLKVSFSEQDPSTNSIAFTGDFEVALLNGQPISRPAGHGTLINNLNEIESDIIFIRNIDNLQHQSKSNLSVKTRKGLASELLIFKTEVDNVLSKIARDHAFESSIKTLNDKYDLRLSDLELTSPTSAFDALNRPLRVCGMVKNEGEPGGGPFWVQDKTDKINRQIVEKSQISDDEDQLKLVQTATHFNPVELICSVKDFTGKKFDLIDYVDEDQYFVVKKTQGAQEIQYIEQPGLWNGAMANWLTLFYEIDAACFSPVKSVFDLLKDPHLEG